MWWRLSLVVWPNSFNVLPRLASREAKERQPLTVLAWFLFFKG